MNNKKIIWLVFGLVAALVIVYVANIKENTKVVKVAYQEQLQHVVLEDVRKGFFAELKSEGYESGKNIIVYIKNGQGDTNINQSIAQEFTNDKSYNVYVSVGTVASQATVNLEKTKPVIFSAITDPVAAKLVTNLDKPGDNVSGTMDTVDYEEQLKMFKKLVPSLKTIGIVYDPSQPNSVANLDGVRKVADKLGLDIVTATVSNSNDVYTSTKSIVNKVDGFYQMADTTVLSGESALFKIAMENKKPCYSYQNTGVEKGGLVSLAADYEKIGRNTAKILVKVLHGEKVGDIPVQGISNTDAELYLNQTTADKLGVKIPEEMLKQAKQIYK